MAKAARHQDVRSKTARFLSVQNICSKNSARTLHVITVHKQCFQVGSCVTNSNISRARAYASLRRCVRYPTRGLLWKGTPACVFEKAFQKLEESANRNVCGQGALHSVGSRKSSSHLAIPYERLTWLARRNCNSRSLGSQLCVDDDEEDDAGDPDDASWRQAAALDMRSSISVGSRNLREGSTWIPSVANTATRPRHKNAVTWTSGMTCIGMSKQCEGPKTALNGDHDSWWYNTRFGRAQNADMPLLKFFLSTALEGHEATGTCTVYSLILFKQEASNDKSFGLCFFGGWAWNACRLSF